MLADIAERSRAEDGVGRRVQDHVAVAMGHGAGLGRYVDARQAKGAPLGQAVDVEADTDADGRHISLPDQPSPCYAGQAVAA